MMQLLVGGNIMSKANLDRLVGHFTTSANGYIVQGCKLLEAGDVAGVRNLVDKIASLELVQSIANLIVSSKQALEAFSSKVSDILEASPIIGGLWATGVGAILWGSGGGLAGLAAGVGWAPLLVIIGALLMGYGILTALPAMWRLINKTWDRLVSLDG